MKQLIHWALQIFYPLIKRIMPYQIYAYLAVGAANTILNILLYIVCYQWLLPEEGISVFGIRMASYTVALLIAFLVTVPTGYWLAKHFAFNAGSTSRHETWVQMGKYFLVVSQGLLTDYLLLITFILLWNFNPNLAKILSTFMVLTLNYLLQKYFTFRVRATCQSVS